MAKAAKATTHARPKSKQEKKDAKGKAVVCPSGFGSHAGMINEGFTEKILADKQDSADAWVVLTDERGDYVTHKSQLDTGLADPNRYANHSVREKSIKAITN